MFWFSHGTSEVRVELQVWELLRDGGALAVLALVILGILRRWWVPGWLYRRKRKEVLAGFLARPAIYGTERFRDRFEGRARENLREAVRSSARNSRRI